MKTQSSPIAPVRSGNRHCLCLTCSESTRPPVGSGNIACAGGDDAGSPLRLRSQWVQAQGRAAWLAKSMYGSVLSRMSRRTARCNSRPRSPLRGPTPNIRRLWSSGGHESRPTAGPESLVGRCLYEAVRDLG